MDQSYSGSSLFFATERCEWWLMVMVIDYRVDSGIPQGSDYHNTLAVTGGLHPLLEIALKNRYGAITISTIHQWPAWTGVPRYYHTTVCWWLPRVPRNQLSRWSGHTPAWLICTRQLGKDLGHAIQPVKMHYTPEQPLQITIRPQLRNVWWSTSGGMWSQVLRRYYQQCIN